MWAMWQQIGARDRRNWDSSERARPAWRRSGIVVTSLLILMACSPALNRELPEGSPFREMVANPPKPVPQGVASGDVTHHSAVIWTRTDGPALVQMEWWPGDGSDGRDLRPTEPIAKGARSPIYQTEQAQDFTLKVVLGELQPATVYRFLVRTASPTAGTDFGRTATVGGSGQFRTAPSPDDHRAVTFVWSGDLGGQNQCRQGERGYPIFDRLRAVHPQFMLFLGDLIYGDRRCLVPPNDPGSDFVATTLDDFRRKHRYQREAPALRDFLEEVPVWAIWDDHEVHNNFSGSTQPNMPVGRRALVEYWPIRPWPEDPARLYRSVRYGADLELFILDTRQYRSPNPQPDGPTKTMLGTAQRDWLIEGITRSTATWKVIATSVPIANNRKPIGRGIPGNDSWARADDGTGFEQELSMILHAMQSHAVRNVVWLAGDVHYTQGTAFDPDGDGLPDFHEFIAGPLSAMFGRVVTPPSTFRPTVAFAETGFANFGVVTVTERIFQVDIVDAEGKVRYRYTIKARSPGA